MPVLVALAEDADMARLFEIASLAFNINEPIWDAFWPNHATEAGREAGANIMRGIKNTDKDAFYLKAYDSSTGEIWGMARWNFYQNSFPDPPKFDPAFYGGEAEVEHVTALCTSFLMDRNEAIRRNQGNLLSLDVLAVHPGHQRKGVGDVLVKWGLEKANEHDFEAVVESSVFGRGLYEKNGFVFVKDVTVPWPEPVQDRPRGTYAWLVRPKASSVK